MWWVSPWGSCSTPSMCGNCINRSESERSVSDYSRLFKMFKMFGGGVMRGGESELDL